MLKENGVPDWPLLATYLISEASLKGSSRWNNYISALPRQPYSLLCWYNEFILFCIESVVELVGVYIRFGSYFLSLLSMFTLQSL